jgi:hypothetical protein
MTRRALLLTACVLPLRADSAREVWDVLAEAAAALGRDSIPEFLAAFDKGMPGYPQLRDDVTGMVRAAEVQCSIVPVSNEGDDRARTLELEWTFHLRSRDDTGRSVRRQQTVKVRFEKQGKHWRITGLDPLSLFVPPSA